MELKLKNFCFSLKKYLAMVSNASGTLVWYVEYGHGLAFMEISLTIVNRVSFDDFFDLSSITPHTHWDQMSCTHSSDRPKQCFRVLPEPNRTSQSNFCFQNRTCKKDDASTT